MAGTLAFGSTLALSTLAQQRILHISTGTPAPIPSLVGFATVCLASVAAHKAATALYSYQYYHPPNLLSGGQPAGGLAEQLEIFRFQSLERTRQALEQPLPSWQEVRERTQSLLSLRRKTSSTYKDEHDFLDLKYVQLPMHTLRICVIGFLAFKVLGGRCWAIAPSSYTHLGSFARPRFSLPATKNYASPAKRAALERLGRLVGCHTCGTRRLGSAVGLPTRWWVFWPRWGGSGVEARRSFNFVGDHMPPKIVAEQLNHQFVRKWGLLPPVQFRFYPQCTTCSSRQGGLLSDAANQLRNQRQQHKWNFRFTLSSSLAGAGGGSNSYFHGLTPRWNHWAGGIVGGLAVSAGASDYDIVHDDNQQRYRSYQQQMGQWVGQQYDRFFTQGQK